MKYSIITKKYNFKLRETKEYPVALPDTDYHPYFGITNGQLKIELFFCWDGSSIPGKGFFKAITFGMYDGDRYCKDASLVHDALCQLINLGLLPMKYKEYIDRLYEKMCISGGMSKRQAARRYWAVKNFGARTLKTRPEKVILST